MSLDPTFRNTVVHAFAVTVADDRQSGVSETPVPTQDVGFKESGPSARGVSVLPEQGQIVGGLYRLGRRLGEGMFGKVYVAQRVDVPEHQVALKLMPRSLYATRNVERELVMLATVGHPHVVHLKDHGMTADYVWLTMPVYEGETLAERLERGTLSLREAYDIFVPIARGLEALHVAGLRHQDIKPDNIYLAKFAGRLHPILLDLGVAAEREATFVAGTALYAAPEQIRALHGYPGAVPLNEKLDTYGLATTLLVSLVGSEGFPGAHASSRVELDEAHKLRATKPFSDDQLSDLEGRPRELIEEAFTRWLALDANDRPTMTEIAEQLEVLLEPEREAKRQEERQRAKQKASYLRFRIAAGALFLMAIAGVLLGYSNRKTLALASELQRVREQGEESFDNLNTCTASHKIAQGELGTCKQARDKDRAEYKMALSAIERGGSMTEAERAKELQVLQNQYSSRLKECEEDAEAALQQCVQQREQAAAAWGAEKQTLMTERDDAKLLAEKHNAEIVACEAEHDLCVEQRDICRASLAVIKPATTTSGVYPTPGPAPQPSSTVPKPPTPGPLPSVTANSPPGPVTPPPQPNPTPTSDNPYP